MLAKKTSKNQIAPPEEIIQQVSPSGALRRFGK
jgi:hypothetical protein